MGSSSSKLKQLARNPTEAIGDALSSAMYGDGQMFSEFTASLADLSAITPHIGQGTYMVDKDALLKLNTEKPVPVEITPQQVAEEIVKAKKVCACCHAQGFSVVCAL